MKTRAENLGEQFKAMPEVARRIFGFIIAGGTAFVIDAGILMIGIEIFHLDPALARVFSAPPAVIANWLINRTFAFLPGYSASFAEFGKFLSAKLFGVAANVGLFALLVTYSPIDLHPVLALAVVTIAAAVINFLVLHFFVYPADKPQQ